MTTNDKLNTLRDALKKMDSIIVAYSGGVDSTLVLKMASLANPGQLLAVTAVSESFPPEELHFAEKTASELKVAHRVIRTEELNNADYSSNPRDRCYYCKKELFNKLRDIATKENFSFVVDGTNAEDLQDWRPGRLAAVEAGIKSPLADSGLVKHEIREISRDFGLPTWNKPAAPCLSSRFPYGQKITAEALERVRLAENFLKRFIARDLRVRDHSGTARIESLTEDFPKLMDKKVREEIVSYFKKLGYKYVVLDLAGFRSGSLNE